MKNKILLIVIILMTITSLRIFAGDRLVYIEFFTSSTCGPCASNNPTMTAFLSANDMYLISATGYHMNWPAPGNDPMYLYNTADNDTRRNYYGINSIPSGKFDGIITIPLPYSQPNLQSFFDQRKVILSPVTIALTDSTFGDSVKVKAIVYCETMLQNPTVTVQIVVQEDIIQYPYPPGTNGETTFHHVMRKMLPTAAGNSVTLIPGQTVVVERKFRMDPIWQSNQISIIAFVQDNLTKEVLNAARKINNFVMMSDPAYRSVNQGQSENRNYTISVPYFVTGYNSPVTLISEVSPAQTGINTQFNNGNVINNFPGSVNLNVSSSASVPTGTYNIIVTGTNTNGKSHKTVVAYLVGKNYVSVRTNRPLVNYIVNGVSYSSPQLFAWDLNSQQTLQAPSPQIFGSTRYVFLNWSNNGDTTQTITVNSNTSEYIANYKTQFRVQLLAMPAGIPVTITGSSGYLDSSTVTNVSVTPLQLSYNGKMYYFQRWLGSGVGSYTGTNSSFTLNVNSAITELALYDTINIGVNQIGSMIPNRFELYQNYPNPFNPETKIMFDLPQNSPVKISVFDITGKEISVLLNTNLNAGKYETTFNAVDFASGIYFYKISTNIYSSVKKMIVLK